MYQRFVPCMSALTPTDLWHDEVFFDRDRIPRWRQELTMRKPGENELEEQTNQMSTPVLQKGA